MKRSLFVIALGVGIGYILGARAGRERYDQIVGAAQGVWEDPRVAKARTQAAWYAREQAPVLAEQAKNLGDQAQKAAKATAARAQDLAGRTATTAKGLAERAGSTAADAANTAAAKASDTASAAADAVADGAARASEVRDTLLDNDNEPSDS